MRTAEGAEHSPVVDGDWERGQDIKRRRLAHGIKSLREFAEATGVARNAITAAEDGRGGKGTYERLEAWLDRFDEETGSDDDAVQAERLVVVVDGDRVTVTVNGPIDDPAALEQSVANIVRGVRKSSPRPDGT